MSANRQENKMSRLVEGSHVGYSFSPGSCLLFEVSSNKMCFFECSLTRSCLKHVIRTLVWDVRGMCSCLKPL